MGRVRLLGVALVLVLAAVSCGDDSGEAGDATTTTAGVEDPVEAYFEALASDDDDELKMAERYAAPGSHAEGYALTLARMHQRDVHTGLVVPPRVSVTGEAVAECFPDPIDLFWVPPPPPSEPAEPGEPYGGERCFDIGDIKVDEDGLLTGFSVNGNDLTERLAPGGAPVESEGVSFVLVGGYQDGLGPLDVVVEIANNSESPFVLPDSAQGLYVDPDGKQIDSIGFDGVGALQPGGTGFTIQPGVTVTAIEVFPGAAPGGTFNYGGTLDDGNDTEVTIDIPITLVAD